MANPEWTEPEDWEDAPKCGSRFEPENGNIECWFCGRLLHAECLQGEQQ